LECRVFLELFDVGSQISLFFVDFLFFEGAVGHCRVSLHTFVSRHVPLFALWLRNRLLTTKYSGDIQIGKRLLPPVPLFGTDFWLRFLCRSLIIQLFNWKWKTFCHFGFVSRLGK